MNKKILILLVFNLLICSTFSAGLVYPDGGGIKTPGYTNPYTEKKSDILFFLKNYDVSGTTESIYSFSYNFRANDVIEYGIQQEMYSQENLKDPDPSFSLKFNIADYMYENVFVAGLLWNTDSWKSVYIMKDSIGIGFNFDGNKGENSLFGGYDFNKDEPEKMFILFRQNFKLSDNSSLIAEFDGENPILTLCYDYGEDYSFYIGYEQEGDYEKSLSVEYDNIFIGVKGEY